VCYNIMDQRYSWPDRLRFHDHRHSDIQCDALRSLYLENCCFSCSTAIGEAPNAAVSNMQLDYSNDHKYSKRPTASSKSDESGEPSLVL
jgi:hypothetical protein